MKKWLLCCCLLLALPLAAQAEDEKIDPANYICAEFVAQGAVSQDPPVFQALPDRRLRELQHRLYRG